MDEKDQNQAEFSLEDIMKEFGGPEAEEPQEAPEEEVPEEALEEAPEDVPEDGDEDMKVAEVLPKGVPTPVNADTMKFEPQSEVPAETPTDMGETRKFEPITEEQAAQAQAEQPQAEPYSGTWEPEYEQPMGEYVPPQPIIFRPKSRLRELKRKLIAGPEKRYYDLTEIGVGRLQIAMLLCLLVVIGSGAVTALQEMGMVPENRLKLMVFCQFFAMLLAALLGSFQMIEGVADLFRGRISLNTLLVFSFIACCVDGVFGLIEERIPCCAAFGLQVAMSLWGSYHKRVTETGQMDTMRKATRLDSVAVTPGYFDGRPGVQRGEGQVEDFMDNYKAATGPEKVVSVYCVLVLLASIGLGVWASQLYGVSEAFQAASVTLLAAVPGSFFVTLTRPEAILEKRLHRLGTVLCGWKGIKGLRGRIVYPLEHDDLFPAGSTKMNGVKFYGSRDPDQIVAFAAALIEAGGSGLTPLFTALLDSRNGRHCTVESLREYENGGIGGEIEGEPVLMGGLNFMKDMGVEVPEGTRVNQAVYMAVDGELCGLFAITYERDRLVAAGFGTLCSYRSVKPTLITSDFMLTEGFLRGKFGVSTKRAAFPEHPVRRELRARELDKEAPVCAMTTQGGLAPAAFAVTGARSLRRAWNVGLFIHILAGCVGVAMMAVLVWLGEMALLTPANLFLYELVWMIPGLLITEWTRSV